MGPGIVARLALRNDAELSALIRDGLPAKGMPGHPLPDADLATLVAFARTLRPGRDAPARATLPMADGSTLAGRRPQSHRDRHAAPGRRRRACTCCDATGEAWRRVTSQADWPTYHGERGGNRYSTVDQIDRTTVATAGAGLGVHAARRRQPAGDARRRRRRDVRHQRQRVLRARRRHRAGASGTTSARGRRGWPAMPPPASTAAWPSTAIACSWSPTTPTSRAQPLHRRSALGDADGRLAAELRCDVGAAGRRQPRRVRHLRRRRRRPRLPRRLRSRDRQGSVAVLDGAGARRAGLRDVGARHRRSSTAAPPRG